MSRCNIERAERIAGTASELNEHYRRVRLLRASLPVPVRFNSIVLGIRIPGSQRHPPLEPLVGIKMVYAKYRVPVEKPPLELADVVAIAATYYGVSRDVFLNPNRRRRDAVVPFGYVAIILARRLTDSLPKQIAAYIGNRDSTCVWMAFRYLGQKKNRAARWHEDLLILTSILENLFEVTPENCVSITGSIPRARRSRR